MVIDEFVYEQFHSRVAQHQVKVT